MGRPGRRTDGHSEGQTEGQADVRERGGEFGDGADGWTDRRMDAMDGERGLGWGRRMDGRTDGVMDRQTDATEGERGLERTDGRTDGQTDKLPDATERDRGLGWGGRGRTDGQSNG